MITTLGFTTRDRPGPLRRCIDSHIANARAFGRRPAVLVLDDSAAGSARATAQAVASAHPDIAVSYAGPPEKRAFFEALCALGLDRPALDFALLDPERCGYVLGANRNALQLGAPGEQVLYVDDDSLAEPRRAPDWGGAPVIAGPAGRHSYWFHATRAGALDQARPEPACLLALHEAYLGRSCAAVADAAGLPEAPGNPWIEFMLARGVVRLTQIGVAGDSCMFSAIGNLLHGDANTRSCLSTDAGMLARAMTSREIVRVAVRPTLRMGGLLIGPHYGCDHAEVLPPYVPVFRSSDSSFSALLSLTRPDALIADLPYVVAHEAEPGRSYSQRGYAAPWRISFGEVVREAMARVASESAVSFTDPIGEKGRRLAALMCDETNAGAMLRDMADTVIGRKLRRLDQLRAAAGPDSTPQYRAAIDQATGWLRASLRDPLRGIPAELEVGGAPAEAEDRTLRLLSRFAALVTLWPAIDAGARLLAARGIRLGCPVPA